MDPKQRYVELLQNVLSPTKAAFLHDSGYFFTFTPGLVSAFQDDGYGTQTKVGELRYFGGGKLLEADTVNVYDGHQRKGIATAMYCIAEAESGGRFITAKRRVNGRSLDNRTPDGQALWRQKRRPFGRRAERLTAET